MASVTRTLTVNAAFFQEIKEVDQELWRSLHVLDRQCRRPTAILNHPESFVACCEEARDQLALHFSLEEAFGYFEDPVYVAPQLCDQAVTLREEHGELYLSVCRLVDLSCDLLDQGAASSLILQIVDEFELFFARFEQHEKKENELLLSEYADDIGVGD